MKIALCLEYPLGQRGGVSVLVESLLAELSRRGHQLVLVSGDTPENARGLQDGKLFEEHFYWNHLRPSASQARQLARQLADARVDLAHFHSGGNYGWGNRLPFATPAFHLRRLHIPSVSTVHLVVDLLDGFCGPEKPLWFKLLLAPGAWCGKMHQLSQVQLEIAVSQHDYRKLRRWYAPFRSRFVQVYHSRLQAATPMAASDRRQPVILNVGHIAWRKGQAVLAEAFARIAGRYPEWKLQLAGEDGHEGIAARIRDIARQNRLEDRILLLGERTDATELMRRAGIYVQPSFFEALGLALQEAMFLGCPVIGSRAGGIPELIEENRTGLLVEPGNATQLSAALETMLRDAAGREQWGKAAAAGVREKGMTVEGMVERHLELYERVVRKN